MILIISDKNKYIFIKEYCRILIKKYGFGLYLFDDVKDIKLNTDNLNILCNFKTDEITTLLNYNNPNNKICILDTEQHSIRKFIMNLDKIRCNTPIMGYDTYIYTYKYKLDLHPQFHIPFQYEEEDLIYLEQCISNSTKKYDIAVHYQDNPSDRVISICDELSRKNISFIKVNLNKNIGKKVDLEISQAKILILVHNYEDYRVFNHIYDRFCLSGQIVVSESCISENTIDVRNLVIFQNYENIVSKSIDILQNYDIYSEKQKNILNFGINDEDSRKKQILNERLKKLKQFIDFNNHQSENHIENQSNSRNLDKNKISNIPQNFIPLITIVSVDCLDFMSDVLKNKFMDKGFDCEIISYTKLLEYSKKYEKYPNHYFFIFCLFNINENVVLNKNKYIIYQLEQNTRNRLSNHYNKLVLNNKFKKYYDESKINLDYAYQNIGTISNIINVTPLYLSIPIGKPIFNGLSYFNPEQRIYDIVFIGCINERRRQILNFLKTKYSVYIPHVPIYGLSLLNFFSKCKILINIHYYEDAILERPRLNEALLTDIHIISEKPNIEDMESIDIYKNTIHFIEMIENNDYSELCGKIDMLIQNNKDHDKNEEDSFTNFTNRIQTVKNIDTSFNERFNNIFDVDSLSILKGDVLIYTANFGGYDAEPTNISNINNYDYFDWMYFTDDLNRNKLDEKTGWNFIFNSEKNTDMYVHNNNRNMMLAKKHKMQIDKILDISKYKYTIWMDASINILNKNFITDILNILQQNKSEFFIFEHYARNNIREECEATLSMKLNKYRNQDLMKQTQYYYEDHYKDNHIDDKLYESGFFVAKNNKKIRNMMDLWWSQVIKYSYQCQLSLPYALSKFDVDVKTLNEDNFVKKSLQGSVWSNRLVGHVRYHKFI